MKAAVLNGYYKKGCDLVLKDIPVPDINENELLVRIKTAGVNPLDNMIVHGEVRMIVPYGFPLVMGNEFAGVVEKVGNNVSRFSPGDRVYGRMPLSKIGAFAQFVAVNKNAVAKVPEYLTDIEAACVPLTALTAYQAFELMNPERGETLFISGGTGSLGAMAIPLAKSFGLNVITNGSAANRDRVLSLGADRFIDYKTEDYSKTLADVDYVLDTLGDSELKKEFSILKKGGKLVSLRGMPNAEFAKRAGLSAFKRMLFALAGRKYDKLASKKNQKYYFLFVHEDGEGLTRISEIFEKLHINPSVDEVFNLDDVNKALAKVARGKSKGKTVIRVNE